MKDLVATVCFLILGYTQLCDAQASCYQCEYSKAAGRDTECSDPFMFRTPVVRVTACDHGCSKLVTKMDGDVTMVDRGCAAEGCMDGECKEMGGEMQCTYCCNSNECNLAVTPLVNIALIVGTLFISIICNML